MASYRSFRGSKGTLGPCRAVCLWRVGLESCWGSAVSHPYGSFSCRFCGFQEGAFSMASYRSFRGSKGTLGPCRAVCLWRVGLESCWGSAVSHPYGSFSCRFCGFQEGAFSMASYSLEFGMLVKCKRISMRGLLSCKLVSMRVLGPLSYVGFLCVFCVQCGLFNDLCRTMWAEILRVWLAGVGPCGPKFFVFGLLVSRKLVSMTDVLPRRSEVFNDRRAALAFGGFDVGPSVCGGFVFDLFPAVRTGAFRADFVASKKVRFRWLPTGVLGVQRVR